MGKLDKLDSLISHLDLDTELDSMNAANRGKTWEEAPRLPSPKASKAMLLSAATSRQSGSYISDVSHCTGKIWASRLTRVTARAQARHCLQGNGPSRNLWVLPSVGLLGVLRIPTYGVTSSQRELKHCRAKEGQDRSCASFPSAQGHFPLIMLGLEQKMTIMM